MDRMSLVKELSFKNEKKILLVVADGLGGFSNPATGRTELETAKKPNLDEMASKSQCGLTVPIAYGITPGSGPAHLSLFGYDPLKYRIGRGVLEALGIGMKMGKDSLACRANYAAMDYAKGMVTDRRAGRLPTDKNKELSAFLQEKISKIEDVSVEIRPGKEHRFVVMFTGEGLGEGISDNDPQKENNPPCAIEAQDQASKKTARIVNLFLEKVKELIKDRQPANYCLIRGFSKYPAIPSMEEVYNLNPAAIATYPMYRGLAQLVGMKILDAGETLSDELSVLGKEYANHDFFYMHIKATDKYGEDGNFDAKVKAIEDIDRIIPQLLSLKPDVLIIAGDHSTPAFFKGHSWHNVPFMLHSPAYKVKGIPAFTEQECLKGSLGIFEAVDVMPLAMANALKLAKYGA